MENLENNQSQEGVEKLRNMIPSCLTREHLLTAWKYLQQLKTNNLVDEPLYNELTNLYLAKDKELFPDGNLP